MSISDQIEIIENRLSEMIRKAETGEQWAEIARIEADELAPLLVQTIKGPMRS